jgi:YggT family protein
VLTRALCDLIQLYLIVLIVRAVFSWIPVSGSSGWNAVRSFVYSVTEPVLAPVRQVMPRTGFIDISFLVVFILLEIVHSAICGPSAFF